MKLMIIITVLVCYFTHSYADSNTAIMNNFEARFQYSMGYHIGSTEVLRGIAIDQQALLQGIKDALSGELQLSEAEMQLALQGFGEQILARKNTKTEKIKAYRERNHAFLLDNQSRPGVITTESGLQYEVLLPGSGQSPGLYDQVGVHYVGSLINGYEFENSHSDTVPATFTVNQVIKGWSEALQLMHQGAKWRLYIPAELGYGSEGVEHLIPPDSTLILDIELVSIN